MATPVTVKVSKSGRITIPKALREGFCAAGDSLTVEPLGKGLLLRRVKSIFEESLPVGECGPEAEELTGLAGEPIEMKPGDEARPDPELVEQRRKAMRKALMDSRADL